jgi:hypothetical protein
MKRKTRKLISPDDHCLEDHSSVYIDLFILFYYNSILTYVISSFQSGVGVRPLAASQDDDESWPPPVELQPIGDEGRKATIEAERHEEDVWMRNTESSISKIEPAEEQQPPKPSSLRKHSRDTSTSERFDEAEQQPQGNPHKWSRSGQTSDINICSTRSYRCSYWRPQRRPQPFWPY